MIVSKYFDKFRAVYKDISIFWIVGISFILILIRFNFDLNKCLIFITRHRYVGYLFERSLRIGFQTILVVF